MESQRKKADPVIRFSTARRDFQGGSGEPYLSAKLTAERDVRDDSLGHVGSRREWHVHPGQTLLVNRY